MEENREEMGRKVREYDEESRARIERVRLKGKGREGVREKIGK